MTRDDRHLRARTLAVIPARYASTRLPGKALLPIQGRPLVQHVWERVVQSRRCDAVVVATDDERIATCVHGFGGTALMTRADHPSGSDRIGEVLQHCEAEIVVNVQGDEPEIEAALVDELVGRLEDDPQLSVATAAAPFPEDLDPADPDAVKVVLDRRERALYFSRARIPHPRGEPGAPDYLHLGLYAFRRDALLSFLSWPRGVLEARESLEQLRFLENGHGIGVVITKTRGAGIDTPEDLERFRARLERTGERAGPGEPSWPGTSS